MAIHPTAIVDTRAEIDEAAEIGPYAVIEGPVRVGPRSRIFAHAYLTGRTDIGQDCQIHPHAVVGHEPQDFGYAGHDTGCRIGDGTVIREGAQVHRGTTPDSETVVGKRCLLMANAHVGHNCVIGDDVIMVNGVLLAGHVHVGSRAFLSAYAAIHQFARIGEVAMIAGLAAVTMDAPPFFVIGRDERCVAVNVVGMRRAGLTTDERSEIKKVYRTLYRSGMTFRVALDAAAELVSTEPGKRLIAFLRAPSQRGILGTARRDAKE